MAEAPIDGFDWEATEATSGTLDFNSFTGASAKTETYEEGDEPTTFILFMTGKLIVEGEGEGEQPTWSAAGAFDGGGNLYIEPQEKVIAVGDNVSFIANRAAGWECSGGAYELISGNETDSTGVTYKFLEAAEYSISAQSGGQVAPGTVSSIGIKRKIAGQTTYNTLRITLEKYYLARKLCSRWILEIKRLQVMFGQSVVLSLPTIHIA